MTGYTPWERCLGGSESAMVFVARALAALGHHVEVYTPCPAPGVYDDVTYHDIAQLGPAARLQDWDAFISLRFPDLLERDIRAAWRMLWCQDVLAGHPVPDWLGWADQLIFVSEWHRSSTVAMWPALRPRAEVIPNPVDLTMIPEHREEEPTPLLIHLSRPERGLRALLAAWPRIRACVPTARLEVARYRSFNEPAGSQIEAFCQRMDLAVRDLPGATHLGHLSKPQLYAQLSRATLMVYPAEFDETSCIAAIESQACGLPVVASARGALPETLAADAALFVEPGPDMVERFADRVVELLSEPGRRAALSEGGRRRALDFDVRRIAQKWEDVILAGLLARATQEEPRIRRTLARRGDQEAGGVVTAVFSPAVTPWPGLSSALLDRIVASLPKHGVVLYVGDPRWMNELQCRCRATLRPRPAMEPGPRADALVDLGQLLCIEEDRPAFLRWAQDQVVAGGPVVHVLPAAPDADLSARVVPTYDDINCWFGESAEVALTVEAEARWAQPARCWLVVHRAGALDPQPDRPPRKRWTTRPLPTISVCMIVRDAADTVLTTLESVRPIADELWVLDTGSKDATRTVVDEFRRRTDTPVHLAEMAWPDDFSVARNTSISQAQGDWILWIDADERLVGGERLLRLLQSEHYEAFAIRQHNHIFDRSTTQVEIPFRAFRNGRGYRFFGAVHEHPEVELNVAIEPWMVAPGVEILHYGYLTESIRYRKLLNRNLQLLMKDFERNPGRHLTDILYLRDCINLANFDLRDHQVIREDHRDALEIALTRFEEMWMPRQDRYYHLGRPYYDQALRLLGWGQEFVVRVGDGPELRHRFRLRQDALLLAGQATLPFFAGGR